MNFKKVIAALSAAAVAGSMLATMTASADEPTVYGMAGVSFQVRDSWEHRDIVGEKLFGEDGTTELNATCHDVNITGNGTYEVSLEGWWCEFDESLMGWIGLDTNIPVTKNDDETYSFTDYPDMQIKLVSYTQDGQEFDLSAAEAGVEDNGKKGSAVKVVNSWASEQIDLRGADYECLTWKTTDPVIIKFTVSGLPNDKVEGYEGEVIEFISGTGAPSDEPAPADSSSEADDSSSAVDSSSAADDSSVADSSSAADESPVAEESSAAQAETSTATSSEAEESSKLPIILGICGGVVVLAAVIGIVIKVKR